MRWQNSGHIQHRISRWKRRNGGVGSWRWLWKGNAPISTTHPKSFNSILRRRFDIWCQALRLEDPRSSFEEIMPPVDVIMVRSACVPFLFLPAEVRQQVWHAYMLNPRCVESTTFPYKNQLSNIDGMPKIASVFNPVRS